MTKLHKLGMYLLIGGMTFWGQSSLAFASESVLPEEPIAGINLSLNELFANSIAAETEITEYFEENVPTYITDLAFAKVSHYVNIRSDANETSEILGKLYNNCAATIIEKKGDWYKIKSGSVNGYIKGEFLVTGEDAMKLGKEVGNRIVTVNTVTLKVREKASQNSLVVDLVAKGDNFKVLKESDGWVKISLGSNKSGYVSSDYVKIETVYEEAVSIEEEQESIAAEQAAIAEEQAAIARAAEIERANQQRNNANVPTKKPVKIPTKQPSNQTQNNTENNSDSSLGSKIVNYALRFIGNPYVWGGTSLTNGADCSGFTQSVFANFGIKIPRTSRTQATSGRSVSISHLQQGDLIFYAKNGRINHVAIYIGNGKVISASSPSTGIKTANYNYRTPVKAVRYIN